ncbi:MAG: orotidine-5'-phosphate decarboxylase [Candidatus Diapherotrites archaeon]|nr:orotidine-5'-phosphate decarboxylase [Candidatus Diapherotrites archaeon]
MNYIQFLRETAVERQTISCLGMDPQIERIPIQGKSVESAIVEFYTDILEACIAEGVWPAACKPQYAFYAQYGFEGLRALKRVCELVKSKKLPLILDAKRGDIGSTSEAYARECFAFWGVDCVTVNPYMGTDAIQPFVKWCEQKGKGIYVLARTSNPSSVELQNLLVGSETVYEKVGRKILEWGYNAHGNVGAVVGAPSIPELERIHALFTSGHQPIPYLIPGVGGQGGSAASVMNALRVKGELGIHRINSSSAINYAFEKTGSSDYAGAAVKALKALNDEIGMKLT